MFVVASPEVAPISKCAHLWTTKETYWLFKSKYKIFKLSKDIVLVVFIVQASHNKNLR